MKKINKILAIANHIQRIDEDLCELEERDFKSLNEFLKKTKSKINYTEFFYKVKSLIRISKGFIELQNEMYRTDEGEAQQLNALYEAFTVICNSGLDTIEIDGVEHGAENIKFNMNKFNVLKIEIKKPENV